MVLVETKAKDKGLVSKNLNFQLKVAAPLKKIDAASHRVDKLDLKLLLVHEGHQSVHPLLLKLSGDGEAGSEEGEVVDVHEDDADAGVDAEQLRDKQAGLDEDI